MRDRLQEVQQRQQVQLQREAAISASTPSARLASPRWSGAGWGASPLPSPRSSAPATPHTAAAPPGFNGVNEALEAKGTLKLRLKSGEGLKSMDDNGFSDPYVKFIVGKKSVSSKMVKKTLNPQWNEELALKNVTLGEVLREPMSLQCWDWDAFKDDDAMGVGSLDLRALVGSLEAGADAEVSLDDGQPTAGRLSLWVQWVPKDDPKASQPQPSPRSPLAMAPPRSPGGADDGSNAMIHAALSSAREEVEEANGRAAQLQGALDRARDAAEAEAQRNAAALARSREAVERLQAEVQSLRAETAQVDAGIAAGDAAEQVRQATAGHGRPR